MPWSDGPARPHSKNAARAELNAEMKAVEVAESGMRLLSESKPKNDEEMMPGALKSVMRSVEEVTESEATECAYVFRYVCGRP